MVQYKNSLSRVPLEGGTQDKESLGLYTLTVQVPTTPTRTLHVLSMRHLAQQSFLVLGLLVPHWVPSLSSRWAASCSSQDGLQLLLAAVASSSSSLHRSQGLLSHDCAAVQDKFSFSRRKFTAHGLQFQHARLPMPSLATHAK